MTQSVLAGFNLLSHPEDLSQQFNYLLVLCSDLVWVGPVTSEVEWYWSVIMVDNQLLSNALLDVQ